MTSLNGIFDNGVLGMVAQSNAMGSISDNIANIDTVGYKRSNTVFQTLLGEQDGMAGPNDLTKTPGSPSNQNGVTAFTQQLVSAPGSIQETGNNFDLALPGNGMFVFESIPAASTTGAASTSGGPVYGRAGNLQELVPTTATGTAGLTVGGVALVANAAYLANQNGQLLLGLPVAPGQTQATLTANANLVPIQVSNSAPFPGQATTTAQLTAVVPAVGATSVSTPIYYYDSAGTQQPLTLTWSNPVRTAGAGVSWTLTTTDANGNVVGAPSTFSFDSQGNSTTASVSISAGTSFTVDTSKVQMLGNAQGNSTSGQALAVNTNYDQNGLPSGAFQGVQINSDGTVVGQYSNGATQVLYQIPLAQFASPDNLQVLAGNVYAPTQASGAATLALPGQSASAIDVGAVEESNVDLSSEFTSMILTQQAYNSSAQVVQAANQMAVTSENLIT